MEQIEKLIDITSERLLFEAKDAAELGFVLTDEFADKINALAALMTAYSQCIHGNSN